MWTSIRRFAVLALASVAVVGLLTTASQAANPYQARILTNSMGLVNPNYQIYPGLSINQYAYNTALLGRAYANVPPYALGYNPYVRSYNFGPVYARQYWNPPVYTYNPYAYGYSPYLYANPYSTYGYAYSSPYLYGNGLYGYP
jgi:hypothetical protein